MKGRVRDVGWGIGAGELLTRPALHVADAPAESGFSAVAVLSLTSSVDASELVYHDQVGLEEIQVELDQCWDALRQRDARREFGQDPNDAKVRPASVVERYKS